MLLLSSLLFGLAASLDAFLVGMTYGIQKTRITLHKNLIISLITLLGTCLSVLLGNWLLPLLPADGARLVGSFILMFLGLYYVLKSMICFLKKYHSAKHTPPDLNSTSTNLPQSNTPLDLSVIEAVILGITLTLNNMGIGFSASITGLPLLPTAITTLLFSVIFLMLGNRLGRCKLLTFTQKAADPISGLLLITLGLCQLLF